MKPAPGLLESSYEECLKYELERRELQVECQAALPLIHDGVKLEHGYRIDLLIEHKVVVEIKAIEVIDEIHKAQLLTYLKLYGLKLG